MKKSLSLSFSLLLVCTAQIANSRPAVDDREVDYRNADNRPVASTQQSMVKHPTGDMLEIASGETINIKKIAFPSRGMSMKKVLNELGKPNKTPVAVGSPPIRLWIYDDRTIYFENMTVIHVVAKP